jgi:hypothetical protein
LVVATGLPTTSGISIWKKSCPVVALTIDLDLRRCFYHRTFLHRMISSFADEAEGLLVT